MQLFPLMISDKHLKLFWNKVVKSDYCWDWTAWRNRDGYGRFTIGKTKILSHRLSYKIHFGKIPDGLCVCHKCDNPACVNPNHLFLGTPADNMKDRDEKGRQVAMRGEKSGNAVLNEEKVRDIFLKNNRGVSQSQIARDFNITQSTVWRILRGFSWKHVTQHLLPLPNLN